MTLSEHLILCLSMAVALVAAGFSAAHGYRAGRAMRRTGGPGLIPFQRAESTREVDRYLRAWGPQGRAAARTALRSHHGVLTACAVLLVAAALHVAGQADAAGQRPLAVIEVLAAAVAVLAGGAGIAATALLGGTLRAHDEFCTRKQTEPIRYATTIAAGSARITRTRRAAVLHSNLTGGVAAVVLAGFGVVELSGAPTPAGPMLTLFGGAAVGVVTFAAVALRRRA